MSDVERIWCNSCFSETEHDLIHNEDTSTVRPDGAIRTATSVLRCRGCRNLALRQAIGRIDQSGIGSGDKTLPATEVYYQPPRLWRRPPDWLPKLEELAPELTALLGEIYSATNDRQFRLLAMGVRAALDNVMTHIVGDLPSFERKLSAMVERGHLSSDRKEMLETVIDAGSAAAHRGFRPPQDLLQHMVTVMENVIGAHYITGPMLQQLRQHIPPRPTRRPPA